jgi:hypothetical protein
VVEKHRNLYHCLHFWPEEVDSRFLKHIGNHV